jgi:hypothetical protein
VAFGILAGVERHDWSAVERGGRNLLHLAIESVQRVFTSDSDPNLQNADQDIAARTSWRDIVTRRPQFELEPEGESRRNIIFELIRTIKVGSKVPECVYRDDREERHAAPRPSAE